MAIRSFAIAAGIVYALVGLLGFVPGLTMEGPPEAPDLAIDSFYGYLLGLFPVNLLHNLVHLAIGAWGIVAYSRGIPGARAFARGLALLYGALAIIGLVPGLNTLFGLVPLHGHDVWLHAVTAAAAAYFGWIHRAEVGGRVTDRTGDLVARR
jgi:hypothetical protein